MINLKRNFNNLITNIKVRYRLANLIKSDKFLRGWKLNGKFHSNVRFACVIKNINESKLN